MSSAGFWLAVYFVAGFITSTVVSVQARLDAEKNDRDVDGTLIAAMFIALVFWPYVVAHAALYELMKGRKG